MPIGRVIKKVTHSLAIIPVTSAVARRYALATGINALQMLGQRTGDRQEELRQFSVIAAVDEDNDSTPSLVYDRFFNHGSTDDARTMTNISPREINTLWTNLLDHMTNHWNVGRDKRSQFAAKDVFFMMLLVLKNGGMWDMAARVFNVPPPTLIQTVTKFHHVATPKQYDEHVAARAHDPNMHFRVQSSCRQQWREKSVLQRQAPTPWTEGVGVGCFRGFSINCTDIANGNVEDIQVFRLNLAFHQKMRVRTEHDLAIEDHGPMKAQFSHE
uniref:AlNc14C118G6582 protein n=1 Tax=Albugo laibachii Nc14 TaxID=890382 RepID=F0WJ51_9STRA|nr:AlNc14C118G6582 [Albugo laibachii Nc14]|eukprot:CCA21297.1 AlNc14C118G6582 [Albugo laibachii Nc14]